MRMIFTSAIIVALLVPQGVQARWIGDYARDYTQKRDQERIARDGIAARREARVARRRVSTRSRGVPTSSWQAEDIPLSRLEQRKQLRLQQLRARGGERRVVVSEEVQQRNRQVQTNLRHDARRRNDLIAILDAASKYLLDLKAGESSIIPTSSKEICKSLAPSCEGTVDLNSMIVGHWLYAFPVDPSVAVSALGTGYFIEGTASSVIVNAPNALSGSGMTLEWTQ